MKSTSGFTLLELMVVLAIAAILAAIALPSFESWLQRERHTRAVNQLQAIYNFARSEAVKREATILLTAAANQLSVVDVEQEQVLRLFDLPEQLQLSLVDIELLATGQVPSSGQWQVQDPRGFAADRCLHILPSGQLRIRTAACS